MLVKRQAGNHHLALLLFGTLLCACMLVGCGPTSQAITLGPPSASPGQTTPAQTPGATPTRNPSTLTPVASPVLRGPTNFLLNSPFNFADASGVTSDDSGATTPIAAATIQSEVTQELQHELFVVDASDNLKVYGQGQAPISAQLNFNADGSAALSYTQTADSEAGTVSIDFAGLILRQKVIEVSFSQQYTPSMLINALASDVQVDFTASVKWVTSNQIPAAPTNGNYQLDSQGGVSLTWTAGQNAVAYDVYRQVSDVDQQFQWLTTVKGTSYIDDSTEAKQNTNATKGIVYTIFSVGPTGVENPGGIVISV